MFILRIGKKKYVCWNVMDKKKNLIFFVRNLIWWGVLLGYYFGCNIFLIINYIIKYLKYFMYNILLIIVSWYFVKNEIIKYNDGVFRVMIK